jgi:hypothetical protein
MAPGALSAASRVGTKRAAVAARRRQLIYGFNAPTGMSISYESTSVSLFTSQFEL